MGFLKQIGDSMPNYRSPHELVPNGIGVGALSGLFNVTFFALLVVFIRSFFGSGVQGFLDSLTSALVVIFTGLLSGLFAIPFGRISPINGTPVGLFERVKKYYLFILLTFYAIMIMSAIVLALSSYLNYPVVFLLSQNLPGLNDWSSLFLFLSLVSLIVVFLSFMVTKESVPKQQWMALGRRKWFWFPVYVVVLAYIATLAIH